MQWGKCVMGLVVILSASNSAWAQYIDVSNPRGPNWAHFDLPVTTGDFLYECQVSNSGDFTLNLTVKYNTTTKVTDYITVINPPGIYHYAKLMNMSTWGMQVGGVVSFKAVGKLVSNPAIKDTDNLFGDVVNNVEWRTETPDTGDLRVAAMPGRRKDDLLEDEDVA